MHTCQTSALPILHSTVGTCLLFLILSGCLQLADASCTPNPCGSGGTCRRTASGSGYTCTCQEGFTGRNCESRCDPSPQDDASVPWGAWTPFGGCSVVCGGRGNRRRDRTCRKANSCSNNCVGPSVEYQSCGAEKPCCSPTETKWNPWGDYWPCQRKCNVGTRLRFRNCTARLGGMSPCAYLCDGPRAEASPCNVHACCYGFKHGWSDWVTAGCSRTCGSGVVVYRRTCRAQGHACASLCVGQVTTRSEACNTQACCEDTTHGWTDWTVSGRQISRRCKGEGTNCSNLCTGQSSSSCSSSNCCEGANLGWSHWSLYTDCSKTCGGGRRQRTRTCRGRSRGSCVSSCDESDTQTQDCNTHACCEDVRHGWMAWAAYTTCSQTCGIGRRRRRRTCKSQSTNTHCSYLCAGVAEDVDACNIQHCCSEQRTEGWQPWAAYTDCTHACNGTRRRRRACYGTGTDPDCSLSLCQESRVEVVSCDLYDCCRPQGGTLIWSEFGTCSKSCGSGMKSRNKECNTGGSCQYQCPPEDPDTQSVTCNTQPCSCDEQTHGWNTWLPYSSCSKTCDTGTMNRTRTCKSVSTSCAYMCSGLSSETAPCNLEPCCKVEFHGWTAWSAYGSCSKNCGVGNQQRSRVCRAANTECSTVCTGLYTESRACTVSAARDGGWSAWTEQFCSVTCGNGIRSRNRTCSNPAPNECGRPCVGNDIDSDLCSDLPSCCQADGNSSTRISLTRQQVSVDSDPSATAVGVIITCDAIVCPGDVVQSITLGKSERADTTTVVQYAAAYRGVSGGKTVDKVRLPNSQVTGSVAQTNLIYILNKIRCEDGGVYHCNTVIRKHDGSTKRYNLSHGLTVTVTPGRFTVTPVESTGDLKIGDVLLLNCSGSVGTVTPTTKIEVVWESRDKGDASWSAVSSPNITNSSEAMPRSCQHMSLWRVMRVVLKTEDNGRTYRCYLRKDGTPHGDGDAPEEDDFTVMINSPFNPVSLAALSIEPQSVTLVSSIRRRATVLCWGLQSQNSLVVLTLSYRSPEQQNGTQQVRELASTDQPDKVSANLLDEKVSVTGGLLPRVINYTLLALTCMDNGTYICTAITKLATTTNADTQEKTLTVKAAYYRTTMVRKWTTDGGLRLTCSTLISDVRKKKDLQWHWETTATDPKSEVATWTAVSSSRSLTISEPTTTTPSHQCFVISTSVLTFQKVSDEQIGTFYRCYVADGSEPHDDFGSSHKIRAKASLRNPSASPSRLGFVVGIIFGAFLILCILTIACGILISRRRRRRKEQESPRRRSIIVTRVPSMPRVVISHPSVSSTSVAYQSQDASTADVTEQSMSEASSYSYAPPSGASTATSSYYTSGNDTSTIDSRYY